MRRGPLSKLALLIGDVEHGLDSEELAKLNTWLTEVTDKIDEKHRKMGLGHLVEMLKTHDRVYAGASGGNLTFSVTPTGLGTVFKVRDSITGETIDLSGPWG